MLINDKWRKCNPINDILVPGETLLWIGRPNEEVYVRGNRIRRGVITIGIWSSVIFGVSVVGLVFSSNGINTMCCVSLLAALVAFDCGVFARNDYKRADWYALSEKRIFFVTYDDEDFKFRIHQTELSNVEDVSVHKSKKAPKEAEGIGNLVCAYHRSIQKRFRNRFMFELIDHPTEVRALLLEAKAASAV